MSSNTALAPACPLLVTRIPFYMSETSVSSKFVYLVLQTCIHEKVTSSLFVPAYGYPKFGLKSQRRRDLDAYNPDRHRSKCIILSMVHKSGTSNNIQGMGGVVSLPAMERSTPTRYPKPKSYEICRTSRLPSSLISPCNHIPSHFCVEQTGLAARVKDSCQPTAH
jgi:hypothetical protein